MPVVPTAARQGVGIQDLLKYIHDVSNGSYVCKPHRITSESKAVRKAVEKLTAGILEQFPGLPNARWVALRLLEGDQRIIDSIKNGELGSLSRQDELKESIAEKVTAPQLS